MNLKTKWSVLLFFLISSQVVGQDPYFIRLSISDGLPSSEVYDLEIDSLQQIWISTDRGVCTYDGYKFNTYTTKDGLADNTNFEIYKDSKNRLWFNGYNQSISYYENGEFSSYRYNDTLAKILDQYSGKWAENIIDNGKGGYFFSLLGSNIPIIYQFGENKIPQKIEFDFSIDSLEILTRSNKNFFKKRDIVFSFFKNSDRTIFPIQTEFAVEHENYWLYPNGTTIYKVHKADNLIEHYNLNTTVEDIYIDSQDNLWVCTRDGIFLFNKMDFSISPKHFFESFSISNILQDFEGNYWLGTNESGVFFVPSFEIQILEDTELKSEKENFLSIGKLKNHIVFGTSNNRIFTINKKFEKEIIQIPSLKRKTHIKQIGGSTISNKLNLGGDSYLKENKNKVDLFTKSDNPFYGSYKLQLENGDLFSFVEPGFKIVKRISGTAIYSKNFTIPLKETLTSVTQDQIGTIWFGTLNGLYKIEDYDYNNYKEVFVFGAPFKRISDIKIDTPNKVWISTIGDGIFFFLNQKIFQLNTSNGLSSDMVNQILLTNDSTLWIASNKGLNLLNYNTKNDSLTYSLIKNLNTTDGLNSNYVNDIDLWNGKIWAATNNGICCFPPHILEKQFPPVPVFITQFVVNDSSFSFQENLELNHYQNDIFIEYKGVSFKKGNNKSFYRYRLTEKEMERIPEWFETNEKSIRYNNLSAGQYTFEVSAQNKLGIWKKESAVIQFIIYPHFTETLWFRIISFLAVLILVSLIIIFQSKRYKFKEQKQRQLKEAQLKTQEAELVSLRNQMNPHFVFNSLNSIQNFIFKKDTEKANYYLSKFSELMRSSLQYTRLDFISIQKEVEFLKNYLELESMRFPDKFNFEFDIQKDIDIEDVLIPSLLLQPILENSVKHAFKGIDYKGLIKVEFKIYQENSLQIQLFDNGVGVKKSPFAISNIEKNGHQPLGLEIINNRIELLNKSYFSEKAFVEYTNNYLGNKGYKILINLPITYVE